MEGLYGGKISQKLIVAWSWDDTYDDIESTGGSTGTWS